MHCVHHPEVDSVNTCTVCSRPLCVACSNQIRGKIYCQDCLVRGTEWATTAHRLEVPSESPKRAALCALIPAMGAVYNRQYLKAVAFFAIFAGLAIMGDEVHGIFGFGAFVFYVFMLFDAYRSAEDLQRGAPQLPSPLEKTVSESAPLWGGILIGLGVLFLLNNLGVLSLRALRDYWPVVFIVLGGYLIYFSRRTGLTR